MLAFLFFDVLFILVLGVGRYFVVVDFAGITKRKEETERKESERKQQRREVFNGLFLLPSCPLLCLQDNHDTTTQTPANHSLHTHSRTIQLWIWRLPHHGTPSAPSSASPSSTDTSMRADSRSLTPAHHTGEQAEPANQHS
jgi:hypothetical protein